MLLKGLHLELLSKDSSEYHKHWYNFDFLDLASLYRIHYTGYLQQPSFELPSGTEEAAPLIPTEDWCETHMPCATRGNLRKGYRHQYIVNGGGHYFSRNVRDAMDYAIMRLKESFVGELPRDQRLSLFLCKAQNVYHRVNSP
ncbi:hypothetical protein BGX23_007082 [Mortierella sp. AD031]|nr:hypothetical protein BGX23_007082 [Mortierella sp. AD031]